MLRAIETASNVRGEGCPWRAYADPFVQQVIRAHRHWQKGELGTRYGGEVPEALMRGVEIFDAAIGVIQARDALAALEPREPARPLARPQIQWVPASKLRRARPKPR